MTTLWNATKEREIANEILQVLPGAPRVQSEDRDTITYALPTAFGLKLATIVFAKRSLRKLEVDPARDVKIDYLQRDLIRCAKRRTEYRYPHTFLPARKRTATLRPFLALASALG
jgi:hypothetical protein